jgi:hypothetical protein
MKTLLLSLLALMTFTFANAQQIQERLDQQPTPVTQQQVERDAKVAQDVRKQDEEDKKAEESKAKKREEEKKAVADAEDKSKKTSTTVGKQ